MKLKVCIKPIKQLMTKEFLATDISDDNKGNEDKTTRNMYEKCWLSVEDLNWNNIQKIKYPQEL